MTIIQKRTNGPLEFEKGECTFVFITPREWPKAPSWEADKNKLNKWKRVKVITAVELEDWLSYYPSVALWVAENLTSPTEKNSEYRIVLASMVNQR